jgi:glycosyltransferase involved in cell wall biosynthesis
MRILMAVPKYPFPVAGGLERQSHALAAALVDRGHEVHALSTRFDRGQRDHEVRDGVQVHRVAWVEFKPLRFVTFPFSLARIMMGLKRRIEIVHVHNTSWFGTFVGFVAKLLGLPVITKLPGNGEFGIPAMRRRPLGWISVALLKRSDAIIAMTPESVSELDAISYPRVRVLKVTNGIPLRPCRVARDVNREVKVTFVGRLSQEKGVSDLFHAWALVKERASRPAVLRVVGDGPLASELRGLASALGLQESVSFCGFCDDVPAELESADIFVLPSYSEGNSNSVLEAMRAGLPVVASRVGGTPIQVGQEGAPYLFAPHNREEIAERLVELIENDQMRTTAGAAMRARIETVFDIRRIAATYEQAYELMLRGRQEQIGEINMSLFLRAETVGLECAE